MAFGSLKAASANQYRFSNNYVDLPVGMRKGKTWRQRLVPETRMGKIAVGLAIVQALITLALEIAITAFHLQQSHNANFAHEGYDANGKPIGDGQTMEKLMKQSEAVLVYHYIFMSAQVFLIAMTWDACIHGCHAMSYHATPRHIHCAMHTIDQDDITHLARMHDVFVHNTIPYEMTLIAITAAASIFMIAITWELYRDFGWQIYKKLGADLQISRMYRLHQITLTFLKFDAFFFIAFSVQIVALALKDTDSERYVQIIVAIPLSVLMICLAMFAIHKESKPLLILFMVTLAIGFGYMIYKLVDITVKINSDVTKDPYTASRKFLYFFLSTTMLLGIISAICSVLCYRYFGRGLLEHRRQHKLGRYAAPVNATDEEARRISQMYRQEMQATHVELD
ncbi:hypothetical protein BDF22DRAFT_682119 [Syncephalis plumigaleata]|nr:hypothetical protein BDF22DRAFT_682119 [Syncephalis plumigaleata]